MFLSADRMHSWTPKQMISNINIFVRLNTPRRPNGPKHQVYGAALGKRVRSDDGVRKTKARGSERGRPELMAQGIGPETQERSDTNHEQIRQ